jgi:vacuolar-type H+-ATPase subunit B/Vma2
VSLPIAIQAAIEDSDRQLQVVLNKLGMTEEEFSRFAKPKDQQEAMKSPKRKTRAGGNYNGINF